jgi:hypothetical protein
MAGKYRINPRWAAQHTTAVTLVPIDLSNPNGQRVSVAIGSADVVYNKPGNAKSQPLTMVSKPATQQQLAYLYEVEKHPAIELDPDFSTAKADKQAQ